MNGGQDGRQTPPRLESLGEHDAGVEEAASAWRPGRPAAVIAVAGAALSSLIPMALVPALPKMAVALRGDFDGRLLAQIVMAAPAAMIALASPFAGFAAHRLGTRNCLIWAMAFYVCAGIAGLLTTQPLVLIASRMVLGAAGGIIATLAMAIAGMFDPAKRDRLIGFSSASGSLAAVGALSLSGWLVDGIGWRSPFALYLLGLPLLIVAWIGISGQVGRRAPILAGAEQGEPLRRAAWAGLLPLYTLMLLFSVGFFMPGVQAPFLLVERGVTSATTQGALISMMAMSSALTAFSYGFLSRRLSNRVLVMITGAMLGAGLAICGLFDGLLIIGLGLILTGIGAGMAAPAIITALIVATPPEVHARTLGINYTAIFAGQFLNPLLLAPLITAFGIGNAFAIVGAAIAVAAFTLGWVRAPSISA